jgi:hypothetical protein
MRMIQVTAKLSSTSPYSQSRFHNTPKNDGESPADWEQRTWKNRLHVIKNEVVIPPMAFKNCLDGAAREMGRKIKGRGNKTWKKLFEAGIAVQQPVGLGITPDDVEGETLFLNADGKPGAGTRVERTYPRIETWIADVEFWVMNPEITKDVFCEHLNFAGLFIGIGRFRPENRGYYGRFEVGDITWEEVG